MADLNLKKNPVLVMAPHTDDGELGCGGTIARLVEEKCEVYYVAFSWAKRSLAPGDPADTLVRELKEALQVLEIPEDRIILYDFDVRHFPACRQEILEKMIDLRKQINPQLIFCPCSEDIHQDHRTIYEETLRAFKKASILGYEEPWNNLNFNSECFYLLKERHIKKKIDALKCYRSQSHRIYLTEDMIRSLALVRGGQLEGGFAEAFEVIRWMM